MKKLYLLLFGLIILFACSKDDGSDTPTELMACFEMSKDTVMVGESLQLTSCAEGANAHAYNFGNGETSSDEDPIAVYQDGGDYNISLTVTNEAMETKTFSSQVHVIGAEDSFIFPDIASGFTAYPMEAGVNPTNGNIYLLELIEDHVGPAGSKYYYSELDATYNLTTQYLADKPFEANSAFVNFYASGNMNFVFSRTLDGLYGTQEITYNSGWGFLNGINSATKHSYGYLPDGVNSLYFGTEEDNGLYKTAVETRNASGDAFEVALNTFGSADSMIGDMIASGTGYIAFGAVFTRNATSPHITNYKPLLVFLDNNLTVTDHVIFETSVLDTKITSSNDLNGSYHLAELSDGNLAMYANGELIVTDSSGNELSNTYFDGTKNNQALASLGNSFVISTDDYLRKFDSSGSQLKEVKHNGNYMPEILEIGGMLFFAAGYDEGAEIKTFYGATDSDLNLINLNQ